MRYLLTGFMLVVFFGCKKEIYKGAYSTQRLEGVEERNAGYLAEAYDLLLFVNDLSELAMEHAELRSTYMLAEDIYEVSDELSEQLRFEARQRDIAVSDNLSPENAQYLEELREKPEKMFDEAYYRSMASRLSDIRELARDYQKHGENISVRDFAQRMEKRVNNLLDQVDQASSD